VLCSRSVAIEREIAAAHSPSRYLHIEAVFVFDGWLEHLSAASGQARRRTRTFTIEDQKRNSNMNTMTRFLVSPRVKLAAIAMAGMLGALLSVSDAQAFTCVRGVYRAGCVSAYGAVGVSRNGAMAVGRYGNVYAYHRGSSCVWRNGQRICF
jgi:hypothetical protein